MESPVLLISVLLCQRLDAEFFLDFRGSKPVPAAFGLVGPEAGIRIKPEDAGLRITLPAEVAKSHVGLKAASFAITGDFEMTVGYEILHADRPSRGTGVGLMLYIMTDTPTKETLALFRIVRAREGPVYMSSRRTGKDGERQTENELFPATSNSRQMRLSRKGTQITFSAKEDEAFRDIHRVELGSEDVRRIELAAYPGNPASAVDVLIHDLRIRAESLPGLPDVKSAAWGRMAWKIWVGLVLVLGLVLFLLRRMRKAPSSGATPTG